MGETIKKVIAYAGRSLRSPDLARIAAQFQLINPAEPVMTRVDDQACRKILALVVWFTAMSPIEIMHKLQRCAEELIV